MGAGPVSNAVLVLEDEVAPVGDEEGCETACAEVGLADGCKDG